MSKVEIKRLYEKGWTRLAMAIEMAKEENISINEATKLIENILLELQGRPA